jgi:hypothetical protein
MKKPPLNRRFFYLIERNAVGWLTGDGHHAVRYRTESAIHVHGLGRRRRRQGRQQKRCGISPTCSVVTLRVSGAFCSTKSSGLPKPSMPLAETL